ncbi:hypothetical protein FQR65_LT18389 [Abscondita terminalis]|nr:hypothetical protein FQR65_LT18389 [Abscondita terminalis]
MFKIWIHFPCITLHITVSLLIILLIYFDRMRLSKFCSKSNAQPELPLSVPEQLNESYEADNITPTYYPSTVSAPATSSQPYVAEIEKDDHFWQDMKPKLQEFYLSHMLPLLALKEK